MAPIFFPSQLEFRNWLNNNHLTSSELLVGYYKTGSGRPSMTWPESVDQALCFGWIDGVRKSIDGESYCIRFTPRRPTSIWSAVNIRKVEELIKNGQMRAAGMKAFEYCTPEKSKIYSFESEPVALPDDYEARFRANGKAWEFFSTQSPSNRKAVIHWIMSAKQESTRLTRLEKTISESENRISYGARYRK
jgi:uncharacterized protein YdeI (YjbR/CyaY-like superfamily)